MTTSEPAATPIPTGMQLTPMDPAYREDPHAALDILRDHDPIHYNQLLDSYLLTRYADVFEVLRDRSLSVDPRTIVSNSPIAQLRRERFEGEDAGEPSMLFLDPPEHDRLRGLVNKAFTPRAVERMGPRIQEITDEILDRVLPQGEFDIIADFSAPLPTIVIAEMLGVDPGDQARFKAWSDDIVQGLNPFISQAQREQLQKSGEELGAYLREAIETRRRDRRPDLITAMIEAEENGNQMTTDEIATMVGLLLAAGNLTTTDLIGNGVYALLRNPAELARLREEPSLIVNAVEEMLRYDPPVVQSGRHTLTDREVAGCPMHAGQQIGVSLVGANHDPAVFPDPHRFDIARENVDHLSFGGGRRYCLGANLARLEAQIAIGTLAQRAPKLRLVSDAPIEHRALPAFRGLTSLRVRVD